MSIASVSLASHHKIAPMATTDLSLTPILQAILYRLQLGFLVVGDPHSFMLHNHVLIIESFLGWQRAQSCLGLRHVVGCRLDHKVLVMAHLHAIV